MTDNAIQDSAVQPLRRAKVFDGREQDGSPLVQRQALASAEEIARVAGYLEAAPTFLFGRGLDRDAFEPDAEPTVPRTFSTDGTWIWSGALTFYVRKYGMPPEPDLVEHIRAQNYTCAEVPAEVREAATKQLMDR